ncbi:inositol phosphorylceramide synthase [Mucilaginibacter rubeus]|uniref:Inositol phosphorylceramide synthase n=1 Tax=Mucilaginibacter rubeus TaxID=2027860 RepID=A0AAE6JBV4_9SPHI|nr:MULTISPECIES: phosphatase PAP2 family protein [Mucilaginibacter]QEM02819.1 inositol phosphorylceramide synthase [Mucilaginibacter rubeus]QEM15437.1 inositol phosphorylceramide synthase [Mucilaginibacter gossypii]QTE41833.1 inositol phosphorylceramide synthase [Mucilaginibacter rubeus]QTE48437.1 inositol phosphorylceramide synthase [Mucilaginibacter rubeus]QTE59824.1 inositol phosphorylceramide synthase [Mucilaginibacter rubeus]
MTNANTGVTVNIRSIIIVSLLSIAYLAFSTFLIGYKPDELTLVVIFNVLFYASAITRKFILGFTIFIVYWIVFDYMKAFPNYNYNPVHIAELYNAEKHLFGIHFNGKLLTPNEYWLANSNTFIDVLSGLFYLCWIPVPLGFAAYLFFKNKKQFLNFSLTFVLVNILGFIVYYAYPAAPPWFVQYHGFHFIPLTMGNTAGLARFDAYFHAGVFKGIYTKGSNVFAAMPSLHSSYPVIVLYYGLKNKLGLANIFFGVVTVGIWFTAVYASHHYVLDVLAGITCAALGITLYNVLLKQFAGLRSALNKYERVIS